MQLTKVYLWAAFGVILLCLIVAVIALVAYKSDRNPRSSTLAVLLSSIVIFITLSLYFYSFTVDDVYISLRYARNLADGHGLVFSTGGHTTVEGYTNFLWVLLETPLFLFNVPGHLIIAAIKIIGVVFGAGTIITTFFLTRLVTGNDIAGLAGALFLSCVPHIAMWSIGGLETAMYIFLMLSGIYVYMIEERRGQAHIKSMLLITLMALTRPEGLFFGLAIILWDAATNFHTIKSTDTKKNIARMLGGPLIFIAIYTLYFLWRYNFYGYLFPNSFYAKKLDSPGMLMNRIKQVSSFLVLLFPFFSIGCAGYFRLRKDNARERQLLLMMLLLLIAFCFASRNEWMPGFRYELPFVPVLMVFFAAGISRIVSDIQKHPHSHWKYRISGCGVLFFLGAFLLYNFNNLRKDATSLSEQLEWAHVPLGKWLKEHAPRNASYASWDMGAVPYYSELPNIIDINSEGLLNTHTTMKGYDVDQMLSLDPSFIVLPPNTSYVKPREILDFYSREKFKREYEFLFSVYFTEEYLLNVFKRKDVNVSEAALQAGKVIEEQSRVYVN